MKTITSFLSKAVLAIAGVVALSSTAYAQISWKGSKVTELTSSDKFYLYNVGTGKFVIAGGQWGTQAMMRYTTVGTRMHLLNGYQSSGGNQIVTNLQASATANAVYLGVNYPSYTTVGSWIEGLAKTLGVMMEEQASITVGSNTTSRYLTFEAVEGSSDANGYTYTIKENFVRNSSVVKSMSLGAGWGMDVYTGTDGSVLQRNFVAFTENSTIDSDYEKLYQWKFVTLSDMMAYYMNQGVDEYGGFNANASYVISDPFFERGNSDFDNWTTTTSGSGTSGRWIWFNKSEENDSIVNSINYERNQTPVNITTSTASEAWNKFVFKKLEFNTKSYGAYTYAIVEGVGSASQSFTVPQGGEGVFELLAVGFFNGPDANAPTITISTSSGETASTKLKTANFTKCTYASSGTTATGENLAGVVGKTIYENANEAYTVSASVYANVGDVVTVTISKPGATQSSAVTSGRSNYYYDTDFTAIDHVAIHFLGKKMFALEEDRTSDDYMRNLSQTAGNNVTTFLKRSFTIGEWNTLVLPINITSAVARDAFGDSVKIAKLDGIGTQTDGKNSLDFKSVDLDEEIYAIKKGCVYLIKPVKEPVTRTYYKYDDNGEQTNEKVTAETYNIGRYNLNGADLPEIEQAKSSDNKVEACGTFIKVENGCPQGAYVYRKGDVYHLQSAMTVKGFRAWFKDISANQEGISKSVKFDGGDITGLDKIIKDKKATGNIYTVDGVVVRVGATSLENLPAGTYIFNGKKYLVK